jgi:PKHD-type hydroxylase
MIFLKNPDLSPSHIFLLEDVFTEEDLKLIEDYASSHELEPAGFYTEDEQTEEIRKTDVLWIEGNKQTEKLYQSIAQMVKVVNDNHFCWSLSYIETLQYSEYNVGGHYDFHFDAPLNSMDKDNRKLSFSILLNSLDEYQGGELEIPGRGYGKFKIEKNSALFFPSSIAHRVCPVTSGIRKSLVGWVRGPNFV